MTAQPHQSLPKSEWIALQVDALWDLFEAKQGELGHGHPLVLSLEEQLAVLHHRRGDLRLARDLLEEVLVYRSVLDGDEGLRTLSIAIELFSLLAKVGDRPAMAEVYYRYLSWLSMRTPESLEPELRRLQGRVEELVTETC